MPIPREWVEEVTGSTITDVERLPGGAGRRTYTRLRLALGPSRVLAHAVPEEDSILPPALRGAGDRFDFPEVTRLLASHGVPVPEIVGLDRRGRWILLEDLGGTHLADLHGDELNARLAEAARLLARVHRIPEGAGVPFERAFDEPWVRFELEYFLEHGIHGPYDRGLEAALNDLVDRVASLPRVLCLRDFQSHNLMVDPTGRLRVIDYQDALLAPAELDLAAFLYDSYLTLDRAVRTGLLRTYESARGVRIDPASLALLVVQRKCKDYARFRFLTEIRGDGRFAPYRERARGAVLEALPAAFGPTSGTLRAISTALGAGP